MALAEAVSLTLSAGVEVVSLVWMEISMFAVAALIYLFCIGGTPTSFMQGIFPSKKKVMDDSDIPSRPSAKARNVQPPRGESLEEHRNVLKTWKELQTAGDAPSVELSSVVHSMQKLGSTPQEIVAELRSAVDSNPGLLPSVAALAAALLRDDAVELLNGTIKLLEAHKQPVDVAMYAGLMGAQLRRRNYEAVSAMALRIASEDLTPKMRTMLATSAVHRRRLDEALGHIRQMSVPADGSHAALAPGAAIQVLALAAREQRVPAAALELQRIRARLETKHLEELLRTESKGTGGATVCRDLIEAGLALNVPKGPTAYQALAHALASAGQAVELRALVDDLEAEGLRGPSVPVGEPLALALLSASKTIRDGDLVARVVELHRRACAGAPGARVLSAACSTLIACDRCEAACDFYEHEMKQKNIWPENLLFMNSLVKVAGAVGRHELAQYLSDNAASVRSPGQGPAAGAKDEVQRKATMIKAYARERDLAGAARVFNEARSSGTPMIYNCFLDACVQCGDLERAKVHFQEMKQLNFIDVVGYNTMLKAYLGKGYTQEAHALVKEMAASGLQANKVTYNELLHAKVLAKDHRGIWSLMDEMRAAGVRANSVTCSILMKSLTAHSYQADIEKVIGLIDEVEEAIDEVLFSSVIEACIRIRQLEVLADFMRRYMQKGGFVNLTAPTYGSMIKAYGQSGDLVRVRELWREMEDRGVKPTSITLGCMTEALVANQQPDEAWELLHAQCQMEDRQCCVNTVIYSTVLKGFAVARRIDKVFFVYKEMCKKEVPCNTITYNTMLDACAKCSTMDRAQGLLEDMQKSKVEPDIITYSTIVKGYCLQGDVDRAFQVLEDMKSDDKFAPDEILYNSILDGCAKQHRVDDALRLLEEMKSTGVIPSNYTLSILVKLLGQSRRLSQAFKLVEELTQQHGFRPNVQVYTCLVQACLVNRRLEQALALHDTMLAESCRTDEKFYGVLARGCLQLHQPLKAVEVVRAAYQLPGHTMATPARKDAWPVGVEARSLDEVASRLRMGGTDEQDALASLSADLHEHRGVRLTEGQGASGASNRRGGGGGNGGWSSNGGWSNNGGNGGAGNNGGAGQHRGQRGGFRGQRGGANRDGK